jgi:hypothetical protein
MKSTSAFRASSGRGIAGWPYMGMLSIRVAVGAPAQPTSSATASKLGTARRDAAAFIVC